MSDAYIPGECYHKKYKPTASILFGWVWKKPTTTKTALQSPKQSPRCHTPNWIFRHVLGWNSHYPVKPCKVHKHHYWYFIHSYHYHVSSLGTIPRPDSSICLTAVVDGFAFWSESTGMTAADQLKLRGITHILKSDVSSHLQYLCDTFLVK